MKCRMHAMMLGAGGLWIVTSSFMWFRFESPSRRPVCTMTMKPPHCVPATDAVIMLVLTSLPCFPISST